MGTVVQVAGVMDPVPAQGERPGVLEVLAVPGPDGRTPGYVLAGGLAVFEALLGRPGPASRVFASVVGRGLYEDQDALILELKVWLQHGEELPRLLLAGANLSPGLRAWESPAGGLAVGAGAYLLAYFVRREWR